MVPWKKWEEGIPKKTSGHDGYLYFPDSGHGFTDIHVCIYIILSNCTLKIHAIN